MGSQKLKEETIMNKNDQQFAVEKIRTQYIEKEVTELDELRRLDAKVRRPVNIFSYVFGSISAIIMGAGMSLVMTELGTTLGMESAMIPGIILGVIGMILALINYPMHKKLMSSRKNRYSKEIFALSDKIMNK